MDGKKYRNVFFKKNIIQNGRGTVDVRYYGQMYANSDSIKNFRQMYDKSVDLIVPCSICALKKYRRFIKVSKF